MKLTDCPIGFPFPNSSCAVSGPSTITDAACCSSDASMKRPELTPRDRIVCHAGVVPLSVVDQFVEPFTSVTRDDDTGATASTSGATSRELSA